MKEFLEKILLSDNVVEELYENLQNNKLFKKWIDKYLPEINDCEAQEQNNPWHIYNVLKHILVSVEKINEQTKSYPESIRKRLAYTMLLHDIGKPECHIRREKDGKMIDSFFNHNIASEKIARRFLKDLDFPQEEIDVVAKLVNKHDIFMFIKDYKNNNRYWRYLDYNLINDEITDLNAVGDGAELLAQLIMVGRSDNLAQNPEMTSESLRMLEKFEKMLNNLDKNIDMI